MSYHLNMKIAKNKVYNIHLTKSFDNKVSFDKTELGKILNIYGKMVALGEWRDYGISILKDFSIFSIYRHSSEYPIYKVKKTPKNSNKKELFSVIAMDGKILKRGNDLSLVLKPLEAKLFRIVK